MEKVKDLEGMEAIVVTMEEKVKEREQESLWEVFFLYVASPMGKIYSVLKGEILYGHYSWMLPEYHL